MGSVIELKRRRSSGAVSVPSTARNSDEDSRKSLLVLVVVFTATAIAMSVSVVVAGSNSWAEAMPLIVFVGVFALTKVFLANALFYVMIRSDVRTEAIAATAASKAKAAGLVIRRPRLPPTLSRTKVAGARPRKGGGRSSMVRLAAPTRKPGEYIPQRPDR
jgi:hypothetical protein